MSAFAIEYEPRLVEEAVLRVVAQSGAEREFRAQRDPIYSIENPEQREAAFQALHAEWFAGLQLGRALSRVLDELALPGRADRCVAISARSRTDEGAELFVASAREGGERARPLRSIVIRFCPERFLDPARLLELCRDELMHVADMLDPAFGYEPALASRDADPARYRLVLDRLRVLWNTTVAGRLRRRGWLGSEMREQRRVEFVRTFPMLGDEAEKNFSRFLDDPRATWTDLLSFALAPAAEGFQPVRMSCPLCSGRMAGGASGQGHPSAETREFIRRDFPAWEPAHGICPQCAELYRARGKVGTGPGFSRCKP